MRRLLVLVAVLSAVCCSVALAAGKNGITPRSPKPGAKVAVASRPTFTGKVNGSGLVFVYVSKSRKTDKKGVIKPGANGMQQKAAVKKGAFKVKAKFYDYPEFWLNRPGTYYWQAHRIACEGGDTKDCLQEGPVVKFKVG